MNGLWQEERARASLEGEAAWRLMGHERQETPVGAAVLQERRWIVAAGHGIPIGEAVLQAWLQGMALWTARPRSHDEMA